MYNYNLSELQGNAFKALASPVRLQVIEILAEGELCFSEILEITGGAKSTLSQNLSLMVAAGILKMRKDSRCNYYSLTSKKVLKASHLIRDVLIHNLEYQNTILNKTKSIA